LVQLLQQIVPDHVLDQYAPDGDLTLAEELLGDGCDAAVVPDETFGWPLDPDVGDAQPVGEDAEPQTNAEIVGDQLTLLGDALTRHDAELQESAHQHVMEYVGDLLNNANPGDFANQLDQMSPFDTLDAGFNGTDVSALDPSTIDSIVNQPSVVEDSSAWILSPDGAQDWGSGDHAGSPPGADDHGGSGDVPHADSGWASVGESPSGGESGSPQIPDPGSAPPVADDGGGAHST
jgi:hypothetical protein